MAVMEVAEGGMAAMAQVISELLVDRPRFRGHLCSVSIIGKVKPPLANHGREATARGIICVDSVVDE
jgi:hypothetical protein